MLSTQLLLAGLVWLVSMGYDAEEEKAIRWCWRAISILLVIISVIMAFGG